MFNDKISSKNKISEKEIIFYFRRFIAVSLNFAYSTGFTAPV